MDNVFDNIIFNIDLKERLSQAFNNLDDILTDHSGPFASNCVIGSKWRQVNDADEFTKDGIKILRHLLVSEEPTARFAARMARFIGIAVDSRCHDGTTTSMLAFCRLAQLALREMDTGNIGGARYKWSKDIEHAFEICFNELEGLLITEDDLFDRCQQHGIETTIQDVRASLAYHMAMISSKGDHDLSSKIATVIRSCPKKIFGMFSHHALTVETNERFILKKQNHDLSIGCNLGNVQDYNYKNGTQFLANHAVVFASSNDIALNSMESEFLKAFISEDPRHRANLADFGVTQGWEAFHENRRHLIIIAPMIADDRLITEINLFNMKNPTFKISWFMSHTAGRMRPSLDMTLHYMAGKNVFGDVMVSNAMDSLIGLDGPELKVQFIGHTMTFDGLYAKDGHVFHPLYRDPEAFPPYTRFARETEELIEFAKENITNPALDQDEVTYLTSLYRALTCQEIYDIEVGGSLHDQYANGTVYEDAIGAALSAVNEGVVLGGYGRFAQIFNTLNNNNDAVLAGFSTVFLEIVEDSLRIKYDDTTVRDLILNEPYEKWSYVAADRDKYLTATKTQDYISMFHLDKTMLERFLKQTPDVTILFQAYGGYHEQFRRGRDLLPKLANTTHLADMRINDDNNVR